MAVMTGLRRRIGAFIGAFEAGLQGRRLLRFQASRAHVNTLIAQAGPTITARARWLVRNNGYALNALESWTGNAVGDGVKPTSKVEDDARKAAIQALWQDWVAEADAEGLTDFYGLQRRAARELFLAGEVFFRFRPRRREDGLTVPLQLQMIPAEMLPLGDNRNLPGGGMIRQGVEFDAIGRRIASVADRLLVTQTGEVGSVGVIAVRVDQSAQDQSEGRNYTLIHAGAKKVDGDPHIPLIPEALADIQAEPAQKESPLVAEAKAAAANANTRTLPDEGTQSCPFSPSRPPWAISSSTRKTRTIAARP